MKDRAAFADVIFMPYNYLINNKIRGNFEINFENSIIIFDEAHNIA
jgi:regulator of telomere elongation helicase 1